MLKVLIIVAALTAPWIPTVVADDQECLLPLVNYNPIAWFDRVHELDVYHTGWHQGRFAHFFYFPPSLSTVSGWGEGGGSDEVIVFTGCVVPIEFCFDGFGSQTEGFLECISRA
jgi:hypothetical protein